MSDEEKVILLQYIDYSKYYMVYGIVTLIIILLLLYAFVRNNIIYSTCDKPQHILPVCDKKIESLSPNITNSSTPEKTTSTISTEEENKTQEGYTDDGYYLGALPKGTYGDVVTYFNETSDNKNAPAWRTIHGGLYLHNSKTWWKDTNRPKEADYWEMEDMIKKII